jgi:hypothetical protein
MSSRTPLAAVSVLCAAGACLALTACGGSGTSTAASAESSKAADAARFARCLREHGIEASASPSSQLDVHGGNPNALEAAQKACRRCAPGHKENLTPAERARAEDAALKFAQCMRSRVESTTDRDGFSSWRRSHSQSWTLDRHCSSTPGVAVRTCSHDYVCSFCH